MMLEKTKFVCPDCKGNLTVSSGDYICSKCSLSWKTKNGIPMFFKEAPPYWSEIPEDEAQKFNEMAKNIGWRNAVSECFPAELQKFILDEGRVNWKYFIESNTSGRILDVGSGWGTLSFALARDCEEIVSLESTWQRIEFIKIRSEQDNLSNHTAVCGSVLELPFEDNSFDVVILNGVLEWLGLSDMSIKPDKVQEKALKEIFRVLKPGGSLYIGVEQGLAFFYFLGARDPHSGLRFATFLPRFISNMYSKIVKKREYRTYIYSMCGYKRLLKRAGFNNVSFNVPVPGYLNFRYIIPLEDLNLMKFWFLNFLYTKLLFSPLFFRAVFFILKCVFKLPVKSMFKYFVPDYSMIAVKEESKS